MRITNLVRAKLEDGMNQPGIEPRSKIRGISTRGQKKRMLKGLSDDTLIKFLIDAAQDANDIKVSRYPDEDKDIILIIEEMLIRMDAARVLALRDEKENG